MSPDSGLARPPMGARHRKSGDKCVGEDIPRAGWEEVRMKVVKRLAVALGSLLALAVAGGAHWRF